MNINSDIYTFSPLSAAAFGEIVDMQQSGKISSSVSKDIMSVICVDGDPRTPTQVIALSSVYM